MRSFTKAMLSAAAIGALAVSVTACDVPEDDGRTHAEKVVEKQDAKSDRDKDKGDKPTEKDEPAAPEYTTSQEQAIGSASDYLEYSAFSRTGLIDQLVYEKFSKADATFAVDHIDVDYSVQAAASAKEYLDYGSFSRQGLIEQLTYEGYTPKQAAYGVRKAGL